MTFRIDPIVDDVDIPSNGSLNPSIKTRWAYIAPEYVDVFLRSADDVATSSRNSSADDWPPMEKLGIVEKDALVDKTCGHDAIIRRA